MTFLVPAHMGSPGKGPLNVRVCVHVRVRVRVCITHHLTLLVWHWKSIQPAEAYDKC